MRRFLLLLSLICVASACSGGEITRTQGDVRIWLHDSDLFAGGEDAIVLGAMAYDSERRCMFLKLGDDLLPVIWPAGARIEAQDPATITVKGVTITEGDVVSGGGGYHAPDGYTELIPAECRTGVSEVAVFNAGSKLELGQP